MKCFKCNHKFYNLNSAIEHLKVEHPEDQEKTRPCFFFDSCKSTFVSSKALKRHCKRYHGDQLNELKEEEKIPSMDCCSSSEFEESDFIHENKRNENKQKEIDKAIFGFFYTMGQLCEPDDTQILSNKRLMEVIEAIQNETTEAILRDPANAVELINKAYDQVLERLG